MEMLLSGVPRAKLAQTLAHHRIIGSTPPLELVQNPGKTLAETMIEGNDDTALLKYVLTEIEDIRVIWESAKAGDLQMAKALRLGRDGYLAPNIAYLREIGRLPAELTDFDPKVEFALD